MTNSPPVHSHYVTSIDEIVWGSLLVALTLVIHGFGMIWTLRISNALKRRFEPDPSFLAGITILILTTWIITFVHIAEIMVWAGFFQWKDCFHNYSEAAYFAFMDYTTVGSEYNLPQDWRLLEGMIATAGLMGFAWSTGVLLTLAQEFQEQQLGQLKKRDEKRRANSVPPREKRSPGSAPTTPA
jgi:hypothetical protein